MSDIDILVEGYQVSIELERTDVAIDVRGARGENAADTARRVLGVPADTSDEDALLALLGPVADRAEAAAESVEAFRNSVGRIGPDVDGFYWLRRDLLRRPVEGLKTNGEYWGLVAGQFRRKWPAVRVLPPVAEAAYVFGDVLGRPMIEFRRDKTIHAALDGVLEPFGGGGGSGGYGAGPITAYGTSTTVSADLAHPETDGWVALLAGIIGQSVLNFGASGALAQQVAARFGAAVPTADVTGGTIPTSGGVTLTGLDIDPVQAGGVFTYTVDLRIADGSVVRGTVARGGSGGLDRIFTRTTAGSSIAVTGKVDLLSVTAQPHWAGYLLLGMGENDAAADLDKVKAYFASMTSLADRRLVWGMLDRGSSEAPGTAKGDYIRAVEAWLAVTYGTDFLPVRAYLSSARALADAAILDGSFSPTSGDTAAVAGGYTPPSFRTGAGSAHLNILGNRLMARFVGRHMLSAAKRAMLNLSVEA